MDVIREITDFIIGKWEGDYRWGDLCQVEWRRCVLEKVKDFYFWSFFMLFFTWRLGENLHHSCLQ
jgi:hypothetical protein